MNVAKDWQDYEILDMANGEKLERWKKQEKKDVTVKRTTIQANSKEELFEKISELDWSKITEETGKRGRQHPQAQGWTLGGAIHSRI